MSEDLRPDRANRIADAVEDIERDESIPEEHRADLLDGLREVVCE